MTREQWLWNQASLSLVAAAARAMRLAAAQAHAAPKLAAAQR
jgi:hypothetical protein